MCNREDEMKFAVNKETLEITRTLIEQLEQSGGSTALTKEVLRSRVGYEMKDRELSDYLIRISDICQELDVPYITAMVYEKEELPGDELFKYHYPGRGRAERQKIVETCIDRVRQIKNWDILLQHMKLV